MIPKIIHYCWFGKNPLPKSAIKCINSWRSYFPDYEIWAWVEDSLDLNEKSNIIADRLMHFYVNTIPYTNDAYEAKKYAFVSDYARFWILNKYGGLYFDTDVELIKQMDDIIKNGPFFGIEVDGNEYNGNLPIVAPGLCLGAESNMQVYKRIIDSFEQLNYYLEDGSRNPKTMIPLVNEILAESGMQAHNRVQKVGEFTLYPAEFFNPLESTTGRLRQTANTRSIHWYMASWTPPQPIWFKKLKQFYHRLRW